MSSRVPMLVLLIFFLQGCVGGRDVGNRYRAERDLYRANREIGRQRIRPDLVSTKERNAALDRYEDIVNRYGALPVLQDSSEAARASRDVHGIVARALLSAAYLQGELGDSTAMLEKYNRLEREFSDLPTVSGEVAFARGQLAEASGDWALAADRYQEVVDKVRPRPLDAGLPGVVMSLPMRIVSLRLQAAGDSTQSAPLMEGAQRYYENVTDTAPGTVADADARWISASLSRQLGRPSEAMRELAALDSLLRSSDIPGRDPARARLAMIELSEEQRAPQDSIVAMGRRLVRDYPDSPMAPKALLTVAMSLVQAKRDDDALEMLDQVEEDYSNHVDIAAAAMLYRGHVLEQDGKWPQALTAFNTVQASYPLTSSALAAPLEIAAHYDRVGDETSRDQALEAAERKYRGFLERYPNNPVSLEARERLIQTLAKRKKFDDMVTEMTGLGELAIKSPQGMRYMINAANVALVQLADTTRAAEILDHLADEFSGKELGHWAAKQAQQLRGQPER